jgi:hypothetical protein
MCFPQNKDVYETKENLPTFSIKMAVFWVVTPRSILALCQQFGRTYFLQPQGHSATTLKQYFLLNGIKPENNPEDHDLYSHHCENLKFYNFHCTHHTPNFSQIYWLIL